MKQDKKPGVYMVVVISDGDHYTAYDGGSKKAAQAAMDIVRRVAMISGGTLSIFLAEPRPDRPASDGRRARLAWRIEGGMATPADAAVTA
jgi:hypothetical protein